MISVRPLKECPDKSGKCINDRNFIIQTINNKWNSNNSGYL